MPKKMRPSNVKPMPKKAISDDRTPEEYFDEAKMGLLAIVDSYKRNASRPDNVVQDYARVRELGSDSVNLACDMVESRKAVYREVEKRLDDMTFDMIVADEWEDPFADMLEYVETNNCNTVYFEQLMCQWARFDAVRPFGEKVEQLRMTLLEKMGNEKMLDSVGVKAPF